MNYLQQQIKVWADEQFGFNGKPLIEFKLNINKARKWGKPDSRGIVKHIE